MRGPVTVQIDNLPLSKHIQSMLSLRATNPNPQGHLQGPGVEEIWAGGLQLKSLDLRSQHPTPFLQYGQRGNPCLEQGET